MQIISRAQLVIKDRQRKRIHPTQLNELKESILSRGLLSPPTVYPLEGDKYLLVAGERRTRAIDLIAKDKLLFSCNGRVIGPEEVPVLLTDLDSDLLHKEAELDENIIRVDLTWQERAEALAAIHSMRKAANPSQTLMDTASEIADKGGIGSAKSPARIKDVVREAVLISEHLDDPSIAKARNATEAHSLILKKEEERVNALLAKRRLASMPLKPDIEIHHGDLEDILPTLDASQFDLIIADPPYGIDAGTGGFRARTVHHHNYHDDVDTARRLALCILTEGFRVTKFRANLFLFTDIKHWDWLQTASARIGWTPFRRPLIWGKSDSEGLAPWGAQGPRITTEFIFFATRGEKGLLASPIDYIRVNRVPRHERIHAAEKPVELIRRLLECSTLPGDKILDPCCGSGSSLVACKEMNRRAVGIEKDSTYYNTAMSNVYGNNPSSPGGVTSTNK